MRSLLERLVPRDTENDQAYLLLQRTPGSMCNAVVSALLVSINDHILTMHSLTIHVLSTRAQSWMCRYPVCQHEPSKPGLEKGWCWAKVASHNGTLSVINKASGANFKLHNEWGRLMQSLVNQLSWLWISAQHKLRMDVQTRRLWSICFIK